jgi:hypothetical protein
MAPGAAASSVPVGGPPRRPVEAGRTASTPASRTAFLLAIGRSTSYQEVPGSGRLLDLAIDPELSVLPELAGTWPSAEFGLALPGIAPLFCVRPRLPDPNETLQAAGAAGFDNPVLKAHTGTPAASARSSGRPRSYVMLGKRMSAPPVASHTKSGVSTTKRKYLVRWRTDPRLAYRRTVGRAGADRCASIQPRPASQTYLLSGRGPWRSRGVAGLDSAVVEGHESGDTVDLEFAGVAVRIGDRRAGHIRPIVRDELGQDGWGHGSNLVEDGHLCAAADDRSGGRAWPGSFAGRGGAACREQRLEFGFGPYDWRQWLRMEPRVLRWSRERCRPSIQGRIRRHVCFLSTNRRGVA